MDCLAIEGDLVPFHFGTLPAEERVRLEAHLSTCATCLAAYFQTKRAVEQKDTPRPSAALRARLRVDVAAEFARPRRAGRIWAAVAASTAAAVLVGVVAHDRKPVPEPAQVEAARVETHIEKQPVDSARDVNARLAFF